MRAISANSCHIEGTQNFFLSFVRVIFERKGDESAVSTVVIWINNIMDDVEREINHGVNTVRSMARNAKFLAGAGAAEIELSRRLKTWGGKQKRT